MTTEEKEQFEKHLPNLEKTLETAQEKMAVLQSEMNLTSYAIHTLKSQIEYYKKELDNNPVVEFENATT